jgi:hypothetical protein
MQSWLEERVRIVRRLRVAEVGFRTVGLDTILERRMCRRFSA